MRFIDANVFGHAFLRSRRELTPAEAELKEGCKGIVTSLEGGEQMATSAVHISEVVNILEDHLGVEQSTAFLAWVISAPSLRVYPVGLGDYESVLSLARDRGVGLNDSLAYHFMMREGLTEVYSMDRHFDRLPGVKRLTKA